MKHEEFTEQYCRDCGLQSCYGMDYCAEYAEKVLGRQTPSYGQVKKQYTIQEGASMRYWVKTYHNGKQIDTYKLWQGDEFADFIEKLEKDGYTRAYEPSVVEKAKTQYEHLLANQLMKEIK